MPIDFKSMWEVFRGRATWGRQVPGPLNEGLVGYWKFQAATGTTLFDYSGHQNHGTINGATWTGGKVGPALSFDGVDDYVDIGTALLDSDQDFTMSLWVYQHDRTVTYRPYITQRESISTLDFEWFYNYNTDQIELWIGGPTGDRLFEGAGVIISIDTWTHLSVTKSGDTYTLYKNGNQVASDTSLTSWTTSDNLQIGSWETGTTVFNGIIDQVRIYDRALSDNEIKALYNATK